MGHGVTRCASEFPRRPVIAAHVIAAQQRHGHEPCAGSAMQPRCRQGKSKLNARGSPLFKLLVKQGMAAQPFDSSALRASRGPSPFISVGVSPAWPRPLCRVCRRRQVQPRGLVQPRGQVQPRGSHARLRASLSRHAACESGSVPVCCRQGGIGHCRIRRLSGWCREFINRPFEGTASDRWSTRSSTHLVPLESPNQFLHVLDLAGTGLSQLCCIYMCCIPRMMAPSIVDMSRSKSA